MEPIKWWQWLWSLFSRRRRELILPAPPSINFDEIFVEEVREVEAAERRRVEAQAKAERERQEALVRRRNEGMPVEAFKKAIKKLAQLKTRSGKNIFAAHDCGLQGDDWGIFRIQFVTFLKNKNITAEIDNKYPDYIWIESSTVQKYYETCGKESRALPKTITQGPYR